MTSARAEMQNIAAALALEHPADQQGQGRLRRRPARRPRGPRYGADTDGALRRRRAAAAHRLRQPGQPAAEPERVARARVRRPRGDRRQPVEPDPSAAHRTRVAGWDRWRARCTCRRRDPHRSRQRRAPGYATPRRDPPRRRRAVLHDALQLCLCVPLRRAARTESVGRRRPRDGVAVGPRLDPAALAAAPQPADWGSGCRDGAALRIRTDGPHDAAAVARRSWFRSAQPADRHVLAGRAGLAGPAKAGVLRRSGRAGTSGSRRRERRHHAIRSPSLARTGGPGSPWPAGPSRRVQS